MAKCLIFFFYCVKTTLPMLDMIFILKLLLLFNSNLWSDVGPVGGALVRAPPYSPSPPNISVHPSRALRGYHLPL